MAMDATAAKIVRQSESLVMSGKWDLIFEVVLWLRDMRRSTKSESE